MLFVSLFLTLLASTNMVSGGIWALMFITLSSISHSFQERNQPWKRTINFLPFYCKQHITEEEEGWSSG